MLKTLKLHRFPHVTPGTELCFGEGFNVLLGRNGTGKTTLLELVSQVLRGDFASLKEMSFDIEYELMCNHCPGKVRFRNTPEAADDATPDGAPSGGSRLPAGRANGRRRLRPELRLELRPDRASPPSRFCIEAGARGMRWRRDAGPWLEHESVDLFKGHPGTYDALASALPLGDRAIVEAASTLTTLFMDGQCAHRFDEALGLFNALTAPSEPAAPNSGLPPLELDVSFESDDPSIERLFSTRFIPPAYISSVCRPDPGATSARVDLPHWTALSQFPEMAGLEGMSLSLAVQESWQEEGDQWWRFGPASFLFRHGQGVSFSHRNLSYGQKRLLSFLFYLDANLNYVVADELVNGMHHDWIRACLEVISSPEETGGPRQPVGGPRQAFLTSQNPLLLNHLPLEDVEQVRRSFIQCHRGSDRGRPCFMWSNLDEETAESLLADYRVGIQHVGELLRARGLW